MSTLILNLALASASAAWGVGVGIVAANIGYVPSWQFGVFMMLAGFGGVFLCAREMQRRRIT